jgi:hypothetical protein
VAALEGLKVHLVARRLELSGEGLSRSLVRQSGHDEKVFGFGRPRPMDRSAKARLVQLSDVEGTPRPGGSSLLRADSLRFKE